MIIVEVDGERRLEVQILSGGDLGFAHGVGLRCVKTGDLHGAISRRHEGISGTLGVLGSGLLVGAVILLDEVQRNASIQNLEFSTFDALVVGINLLEVEADELGGDLNRGAIVVEIVHNTIFNNGLVIHQSLELDLDGLACVLGRVLHGDVEGSLAVAGHIRFRESEIGGRSLDVSIGSDRVELVGSSLDGQANARGIGECEGSRSRVGNGTGQGVGQSVTNSGVSLVDGLVLLSILGVLHVDGVIAMTRIDQLLLLRIDGTGSNDHRNGLGDGSLSRIIHEHVDTWEKVHGGGPAVLVGTGRSGKRDLLATRQLTFRLKRIGKCTSGTGRTVSGRGPRASGGNVQSTDAQGGSQIILIRLYRVCAESTRQSGVNRILIGIIRDDAVAVLR